MRTIIENGKIVNEGRVSSASLIIDDDRIEQVVTGKEVPRGNYDNHVDATGCFVLPGIIDEHVHFREPGMTQKADIESESRTAAWGGVTTYFEMPNTNPSTTTPEALVDKMDRAARTSHVNYSFFYGATNRNAATFKDIDRTLIPGIKLFMGASTGGMLVEGETALDAVFETCADLRLPLMTHCEDSSIINRNMARMVARYGEDPAVRLHPLIRSVRACMASSSLAVELAKRYGTRLHIAHISTQQELALLESNTHFMDGAFPLITGEAVISHLLFCSDDYDRLGALIKCNPAVKAVSHRRALRRALTDGRITCIGTDHAPHLLSDKQGGCRRAASGMPMVQFSLVAMLGLVDRGVLSMERMVQLMCHNPARLFEVKDRGFLRKGYKADVTIVRRRPWVLAQSDIQSKCGWSPLVGQRFDWQVVRTICNGHTVYHEGKMDEDYIGEAVRFRC